MSVRKRLTIAFGIMLTLLLVQAGISIFFSVHNAALTKELITAHTASNFITGLAVQGQKLRRYEKEYFIYVNDESKRNDYAQEWRQSHDQLKNKLVLLQSGTVDGWSDDDMARAKLWDEALNGYAHGFTRIDIGVMNGVLQDTVEANKAIQEAKNKFRVFLNGTAEQIDEKFDHAQALGKRAERQLATVRYLLAGLAILGMVIGIAIILYVPNTIATPLRTLSALADEMSKGKIQQEIPNEGPPEIRELASSMERLRVAVRGILQRLPK